MLRRKAPGCARGESTPRREAVPRGEINPRGESIPRRESIISREGVKITSAAKSTRIPESAPSGDNAPDAKWRRSRKSNMARGSTPIVQSARATRRDSSTRDTSTQRAPFTPARKSYDPSAPTSTRKISATFSTDCPLSGHATVACSAVTASITTKRPGPPSNLPASKTSAALSSSQSYRSMDTFSTTNSTLKASHTCSNLPMPAAQYKAPSAKPSVSTAYANAKASKIGRNTENIPPSASMADLPTRKQSTYRSPTPRLAPKQSPPKPKMKSRLNLSKSRPFNVFSNFTASLSRTSLSQLTGNESRRTSVSSKSTARKVSTLYTNSQSESSTSSQTLPNATPETTGDARQIHTAQTSAYWAGRFMALQDKFQSEALLPENLTTLVHAHAERSLLPVTQPSLASSATTGCIAAAARPTARATAESTSPRKRRQSQQQQQEQQHISIPRARTPANIPPSTITMTTTTITNTTVAPPRPSNDAAAAAAASLVDEDNRCRRIFSHLDSLCTTGEARLSLQHWQQCYARRTGKEHLFVAMPRQKTRELTWVGRLLIGSNGGGHSKRGSLGL
ncbi:hypothetical protein F5Y09DRAFT_220787 [Xylaria sp. FL1042]|nr:hypothetical protein F5Y09DRAFT_220787 [Xylaria sp. FL1042]